MGHTGIENDTFTLRTAERFAEQGFHVAAPFIFHWWPKDEDMRVKAQSSRDEWTVADLRATFDLLPLQGIGGCGAASAVVGHCWGGRVAWLGACHIPELAACAMFYGGRIKLALGEGNPPAIDLADRIRCPVAGFFGNEDQNPVPAGRGRLQRRAVPRGRAAQFSSLRRSRACFPEFSHAGSLQSGAE